MNYTKKKSGFTLSELLVVLFVFSVLVSIIYSSVRQIHKQALTISCRLNMQTLSKGFLMYALDYDGILPHSDRDSDLGRNHCWFDVLDPYLTVRNLSEVKQCAAWQGYKNKEMQNEHSIKMNGALCNRERKSLHEKDGKNNKWYWPNTWYIKQKSRTVLLVDGTTEPPLNHHTDTRIHQPYKDINLTRHGGVNLLFLNGTSVFVPKNLDIDSVIRNKFIWEPYAK
ncbi:prepilin-type N-terminal cleavage/methylation domain-containing protein [Candidatus Uabimicrobium sp. HlEnr_7]|uniref:prepilin-type N-terminal cleavage/methylation domain-containing protein n=1 Tax=Candidatus Uabimicrobium helgolandensis TaxID=3095367 RepID=UPI0035585504